MSNSEINIRGGIGTQIIRYLIGLSFGRRNIVYDFSPYSPNHIPLLKEVDLFESHIEQCLHMNYEYTIRREYSKKLSAESMSISNLSHMIANRDELLKMVTPILYSRGFAPRAIHVRRYDSAFVSDEYYSKLFEKFPGSYVITDDVGAMSKIDGDYKISPTSYNANLDWLSLHNTVECIGPYSGMTFSAAFFNPDLKLYVIPSSKYNSDIFGGAKRINDAKTISDLFVEKLPNVNYLGDI